MILGVLHVKPLPEPVDPALVLLKAGRLAHHIDHIVVLKDIPGRFGIGAAAFQTNRPDALVLSCGGQDQLQHLLFVSHLTGLRRVPMPSIKHSTTSPGFR